MGLQIFAKDELETLRPLSKAIEDHLTVVAK